MTEETIGERLNRLAQYDKDVPNLIRLLKFWLLDERRYTEPSKEYVETVELLEKYK